MYKKLQFTIESMNRMVSHKLRAKICNFCLAKFIELNKIEKLNAFIISPEDLNVNVNVN